MIEMKFGSALYKRHIVIEGQDVVMVSADGKTWCSTFLGIRTNAKMPTQADIDKHELYMKLSTKASAKGRSRMMGGMTQAGNYHPPRVFQTLHKRYLALDAARRRMDLHAMTKGGSRLTYLALPKVPKCVGIICSTCTKDGVLK